MSKNIVYLTRIEYFNAAHKLYNAEWSEAKNEEVFGKCANKNWHGHNYELHVTVSGVPDPETGFVMNAKILSKIIKEKVTDVLDHKNINLDVDFMKGKFTSSENIAIGINDILAPEILKHGVRLHKILLKETRTIYVEYYNPE